MELFLDEQEIEKVSLVIEYQVDVVKTLLVSHFEVETRGRFFSFAPIMREVDMLQWNVVLSYPQTS